MKNAFLLEIFFTKKPIADFDITHRTAIANGYKMFCIAGNIYSTEAVTMRKDKQYASMVEAVLFKLTDLIA